MAQAEKEHKNKTINPLIWVSIVVIALILYIFFGSDRATIQSEKLKLDEPARVQTSGPEGQINRELLVPPGLRAREYIRQIREQGKPYPFDQVMGKASSYANEGSLADAHLVFFFAAREGHVEAMMMMAEMSDPTLFQAENNLLDTANAIQAYKWYRLALDQGFEPARPRLDNLAQWARAEAAYGNAEASQLLLNFN